MKPYYEDEWVTIYHGDCREILPLIPYRSVDLVFADPPYGVETNTDYSNSNLDWSRSKARGKVVGDDISSEDLVKFNCQWLPEIKDIATVKQDIYICFNWKVFDEFSKAFRLTGMRITSLIIWDRMEIQNAVFKYNPCHEFVAYFGNLAEKIRIGNRTNVWRFSKEANNLHPTMKPISMIMEAILDCTQDGALILDPFLGSGTTAFAAKRLNRKCIGIEIEEKYCEIAASRCCQTVMDLSSLTT